MSKMMVRTAGSGLSQIQAALDRDSDQSRLIRRRRRRIRRRPGRRIRLLRRRIRLFRIYGLSNTTWFGGFAADLREHGPLLARSRLLLAKSRLLQLPWFPSAGRPAGRPAGILTLYLWSFLIAFREPAVSRRNTREYTEYTGIRGNTREYR